MDKELENAIESILFVAGEAVSIEGLADAIDRDISKTKDIIKALIKKYDEDHRGIQIIEINDSYQMCSRPDYFPYIKKLYNTPKRKILTQTLLETLAIIAYKQPITKGQIEEIRGVDAGHAVNKLMEYNLVCEEGRQNAPGRPILFGTTDEFLRYFGFVTIKDLPLLEQDMEKLKKEAEDEIEKI